MSLPGIMGPTPTTTSRTSQIDSKFGFGLAGGLAREGMPPHHRVALADLWGLMPMRGVRYSNSPMHPAARSAVLADLLKETRKPSASIVVGSMRGRFGYPLHGRRYSSHHHGLRRGQMSGPAGGDGAGGASGAADLGGAGTIWSK